MIRKEKVGMEKEKRDGGGEKGKKENGKGEEKRKVGRPGRMESMKRKRANSMPLLELFKRGEKRKIVVAEIEAEEREVFKRSSKIKRSPERKGAKEILRKMRESFREMKSEIRERESREKMKKWMEEMRKGWEKENEGLRKRLDRLEKKVEENEKGRRGGRKMKEERKRI